MNIHGPVWWPKMGFRKSPKAFVLNGLGRFFANMEKRNLKTWNGRPRDIEKQSARATTAFTTKTAVPQVLENVTRERTPHRGITMEDLPTLHGNAISCKKRTPRCMGRASAGASTLKCLTGSFIKSHYILSIWIWPYVFPICWVLDGGL